MPRAFGAGHFPLAKLLDGVIQAEADEFLGPPVEPGIILADERHNVGKLGVLHLRNYSLPPGAHVGVLKSLLSMIGSTRISDATANVKTGAKPLTPLESACVRLRACGLRVTEPRMAILSALLSAANPGASSRSMARSGRAGATW